MKMLPGDIFSISNNRIENAGEIQRSITIILKC